jgi:hypothetical protein
LASRQLFRPELVQELRRLLARAVVPKGSLRLEIPEAMVMENPEKATSLLAQLAETGAGLSLDDFGTGFSSLSYLSQFTFDAIKIDAAFLQAGSQNGGGSVILRSVVALSHELGKGVVTEGVETEEDVAFLRSIGCEYGQGPYFGTPMAEREVMHLIKVARKVERRMKKSTLFRRRQRPAEELPLEAPLAAKPAALPAPSTAPANGSAARAPEAAPAPLPRARAAPEARCTRERAPPSLATAAAARAAGVKTTRARGAGVRFHPLQGRPAQDHLRPGRRDQDHPRRRALRRPERTALVDLSRARRQFLTPKARKGPPPPPARGNHPPPPGPAGPPPRPKAAPPPANGALPPAAARSPAPPPPLPRTAPPVPPAPARPNGRPGADFSTLPPAIAESLARLAGRQGTAPVARDKAETDSAGPANKPPQP